MKTTIILLISLIIVNPLVGRDNTSVDLSSFVFDSFMFRNLPGAFFPGFFLENYAPDITLLIEENNGFSHIDNPRVYFEGESFLNFNWYYDGFNTNSALEPGSSAILFPFSTYSGYKLKGYSPFDNNRGLHFISDDHNKTFSRVMASSVFSDLGSYTPLGPVMIQPEHPTHRAEMLNLTRRKIDSNYFFDYMLNKEIGEGYLSLAFNHYYIKRQFNDFNESDQLFSENGKYNIISLKYKRFVKNGYYELLGGFNSLNRDNLYAELGRLPQETVDNNKNSIFTGIKFLKKRYSISTSFIYERSKKSPFVPGHSKNIFDNDGDDIFSKNSYGEFISKIFSTDIRYSILKGNKFSANIFGNSRFSELTGDEYIDDYNTLFAEEIPYKVIVWNRGEKYTNYNFKLNTGLNFSYSLSGSSFLAGKIYLDYNALSFDYNNNNISFLDIGFDIAFYTLTRSSKFMLSAGRAPGNIRENVNFFLERSRPSGSIYSWNDVNSDKSFQSGEEGVLFGYTGGDHHFLDEDFTNSVKNSILLIYSKKISKNFVFNLKALYNQFLKNPWVRFDEDYGNYETINGEDLYFFNKPFDKFILSNSQFKKDPFYAQLLLNFTGRVRERWFFSFSFMAHMGMGFTPFGNGANSNVQGIIDESMADPNSWINGYGRVDGDRGFVSKLYFGYFLSKKFFLGVSIKYRDGDPFAFLNRVYKNDQWVLYYDTIQAEDAKGIKGGPREDYVSDISLKLNYSFRLIKKNAVLSLSFFNILDFGSELSEYVFSGGERYSMEMQIPKSIRLNLMFEL